jgi:hypothetical protein
MRPLLALVRHRVTYSALYLALYLIFGLLHRATAVGDVGELMPFYSLLRW